MSLVLMSALRFASTTGQDYSLTFDPGLSQFDSFKHLKSHWATYNQISCKALGTKGTKTCSNGPAHMTNMTTRPIYV